MADFNKAIELNPKNGMAYQARGCLRYDLRSFSDALSDFRTECELKSGFLDYSQFRYYLVRARQGDQERATGDLKRFLQGRTFGRPGDWESQIGRFLSDQLSEANFINAAKDADPKRENSKRCEAHFYAGTKRLLGGDKTTAKAYFEKSPATGEKDSREYASARAELKYLEGAK